MHTLNTPLHALRGRWGEEATEGEADRLIVYPRSTRRCFDCMMDEDYLFHCANGAGEDRHIRQGALLLQDREYVEERRGAHSA